MTVERTVDEPSPPLLAIARSDFAHGAVLAPHHHRDHMIAWAATATVTLRTGTRDWLVPPTHALWVPAGTAHSVEVLRQGDICTVVLEAAHCPIDWAEPTGVRITPLIRELIVHLDRHPHRDHLRRQAEALLLALLEPVPTTTFEVPLPEDSRIRVIADALIADPADDRDLAGWARHANAGVRTITRLFADETGMTFARWRTHVRVRAALTHLARGASVGATARAVGYRKPGAFAATFQRVTGQPPSIYRP
ncbi:AraC family transcriptional regulator [Nocardia sp. NPDC052566]|uniref:AraC family transcriptional regulator n=1 Tax=Nocardia sp. NPDC052566 TaxID=3364330 RepID=UPI0037C7EDA7